MVMDCNAIYFMKDFKSFRSVQLTKYCSSRKSGVKGAELDMVNDLIKDYWCDLLASGHLNDKTREEKWAIFNSITIVFPYTKIPEEWKDGVTYVDFRSYSLG